jgi:hypothetical protein
MPTCDYVANAGSLPYDHREILPPHHFLLDPLSLKIGNLGGARDMYNFMILWCIIVWFCLFFFLCTWNRSSFFLVQVGKISSAAPTSDLEGRIREGMLLSSNAFVAQTLSQIHSPENPSYGLEFNNNLCAALSVQPPVVRTFVKLLSENPGNTCSNLLVDVVKSWIKLMSETFLKTAAGIQNVQIDFDRGRELKLQSFIAEFMEEYNASGLPPPVMSKIGVGHLGRFLHHVLCICSQEKPPVELPVDCLMGKHTCPVIYYAAGWMLYCVSKALTLARDRRPLFLDFSNAHSIDEDMAQNLGLPTSHPSPSVPWSGTSAKGW